MSVSQGFRPGLLSNAPFRCEERRKNAYAIPHLRRSRSPQPHLDGQVHPRESRGTLEYARFEGRVGRVVTVNYSGKAIVDFADGAWYDIPASDAYLELVPEEEAKGKYDATANSAQKLPGRQG